MTIFTACLIVLTALHVLTPFWWWVMAVPLFFGLTYGRSAWRSARPAALAAGSLWLAAAAYGYFSGGKLVAGRMAGLFGLGPSWLLVPATGLLAALAAGVAGLAGYSLRAVFRKKSGG